MTVAELIGLLETLPKDATVVMSKDAEGNAFRPVQMVSSESARDLDIPAYTGSLTCYVLWPEH